MDIEKSLQNKNAKQKAQLKSKELAKVKLSKFKKDDFDIEIIGDIKEINGGIELFAKAFKNGKQIGFGKDGSIEIERFRFFNPPVLVDDENGDIIKEYTNEITKEVKQRKLKYDLAEAIRQMLSDTIFLVAKDGKNIIKDKVGNTTSTFYSGAGDGLVNHNDVDSWTTVRNAETGTNARPTDASNTTAGRFFGASHYMYRSFFPLNTEDLPDDAIIASATFSVKATADAKVGSPVFCLIETSQPSPTTLTTADWDAMTIDSPDEGAERITPLANQYNTFTLNATGLGWINKSGYTMLGVREQDDVDDALNDTSEYLSGYHSEETGTTSDPKLVIEHSVAVSSSNFFQFF